MFELNAHVVNHIANIASQMDKANYKNLGHAAASLRKRVIESVQDSPFPSRPGRPPQTRRGALRRAIVYKVDGDGTSAIIGARYSRFGTAGAAHEFGGEYKGATYPMRPFMAPGLEATESRFHAEWHNSLGG